MLRDLTIYGKLLPDELCEELAEVTALLYSKFKELAATKSDYNREWYPIYFRSPGNSVAAKEREANYECLQLLDDIDTLEADIAALTAGKECLTVILSYRGHVA
jgi:hypothetical protein